MIYDLLPLPAVIAHRGASKYAPENTLAAFRLAGQQGANAIELDVMLTSDQQVVVIHDRTLDRTTTGSGEVAALSLDEIKRVDAGSWFGPEFAGETVPLLEEVFQAVGKSLPINIELKNHNSPNDDLPVRVAQLVRRHQMEQRVFFSSFNPIVLYRIQKLLPLTPVGLLTTPDHWPSLLDRATRLFFFSQAFHPSHLQVDAAFVQRVHRQNRRIYAYTVNDPQRMVELRDLGVDGIITDDPRLALSTYGRGG